MPTEAAAEAVKLTTGYGAMAALVIFIAASVWLGTLAQRVVDRSSFMQGYFLGNRGLGSWAVALTATVQSGGTFMGFPSYVYKHGWVVALWISSYMVVPITAFGLLGKRLAQISRRTGAITVPDLFRARFSNPTLGLVASLIIMFFMTFMMIAQFKAGAIVMKIAWPGTEVSAATEGAGTALDQHYYVGLAVFTLTVVGYTLIGGFLAAVWTDLFQSVLMFIGVVFLVWLAMAKAGGLEHATQMGIAQQGAGFVFGPGAGRPFHPVGLAFSTFFVWVFAGLGSPASVVRVMACKNTETLRRSIFVLSVYNSFIYMPLIMICIAAHALMPNLKASDEVVPRMALMTTSAFPGGSFLAGLILAAPFGAVMATVSCYLVVISSGLVRDIYQRFINPEATGQELKRLSYFVMVLIGAIGVVANIKPVEYLQAIVVFSGTSLAASFVVPALMACYWRRATWQGALAAMLGGGGSMFVLYAAGWVRAWWEIEQGIGPATKFAPYYLMQMDPIVWGLACSLIAGIVVSLSTEPPAKELVSKLFDAPGAPAEAETAVVGQTA